jgi:hypothetical protein
METSALTGEAVVDVFEMLTRRIIEKIESGQIDPKSVANGIMADSNTGKKSSLTATRETKPTFLNKIVNAIFNSCQVDSKDV